jgi:O-antigen ligase
MTGDRSERAGGLPGGAAALDAARRLWRPACVVAFFFLIAVLVPGRVPLPGGGSIGFKSLARNVAVAVLIGAWLRADGLVLLRSRLVAPLAGLALAAWASVLVNAGAAGDARYLVVVIGVFYAARLLAAGRGGHDLLFHWLGAFAIATVAAELLWNPSLLELDPAMRDTLRFTHPNSLGGSLAVMLPVFAAALLDDRHPFAGALYVAAAALGIALSFSRSGLLASVVAVVLVVAGRRTPLPLVKRPWRLAGVAVAAMAAVAWLSLDRGEADSQRLRILNASLSLFAEHPLLGIGFGIENLRRVFPARYIELYGQSLFLFHSHNMYVEALVAMGFAGALALAWLVVRLATLAIDVRRRAVSPGERASASGLAASVAAFLLLGATDSLFYQAQTMIAVAVVWAILDDRCAGPPEPVRAGTAPSSRSLAPATCSSS